MPNTIFLLLTFFVAQCSWRAGNGGTTSPAEPYRWVKVLDAGPWPQSYNFQMFSRRDTLWVFHPRGNWYSTDEGRQWQRSPLPNAINNQAFLDYVAFKQRILGLGRFEGNIERYNWQPIIFSSAQFQHWDTLSTNSNLPPRFFYHPFVWQNALWIVGGEDAQQSFADVWSSTNGVEWTQRASTLPWGPRSGSQVVTLGDRLFLLNNDVWSSPDGLAWTQVTPAILPGEEIFGYCALVFDAKIWLLGCNRNGRFSSQVLYSQDGKHWQHLDAPWSPRGGVAAVVHQGKIFLTGGKYGGTPSVPDFRYSNDLWCLERNP